MPNSQSYLPMIRWSVPRWSLTIINSTRSHIFLISVKKAWHRTARKGFKNVCLTSKAILSSILVFICHLKVNKQWEMAIIYSEGLRCKTSSSCFIFKGMLLLFLVAVRLLSAMTDGSVQDYKTHFTTIQSSFTANLFLRVFFHVFMLLLLFALNRVEWFQWFIHLCYVHLFFSFCVHRQFI